MIGRSSSDFLHSVRAYCARNAEGLGTRKQETPMSQARIIDGKAFAAQLREQVAAEVAA
jgi:hypothetical protein